MNIQVININSLGINRGIYADWMGNALSDEDANALLAEGAAVTVSTADPGYESRSRRGTSGNTVAILNQDGSDSALSVTDAQVAAGAKRSLVTNDDGAIIDIVGSYPCYLSDLRDIIAERYPVGGLALDTRSAINVFTPSPATCFSDTAGTTPAVQDGSVALWKEATGKGFSASQATTGWQPKLRKGALNIIPNSTMQGASVGTTPTSWTTSQGVGISIAIVGVGSITTPTGTHNYIDVRYSGTATANGAVNICPSNGNYLAASGQRWCFGMEMGVIAGAVPATGLNLTLIECTSTGTYLIKSFTPLDSLGSTVESKAITRLFDQPTTALGQAVVEYVFSTGAVVDFTLRLAAPQLELGVSTISTYAKTSGAPASNGVGNWWLDFDGSQSRMYMTPIAYSANTRAGCTVSAAFSRNNTGLGSIFTTTDTGTQRVLSTYLSGNLGLSLSRDESSNARSVGFPTIAGVGASHVISIRQGASDFTFRDSVSGTSLQQTQSVGNFGNTTPTMTGVGVQNGSSILNGGIYGIAWCDGVAPTDADVLKIERYIGNLAGVTI